MLDGAINMSDMALVTSGDYQRYYAVSYTHLEQITYCAQRVKAAGASLLRGGAFKPRPSPYSCLLYTS